MRLAIYLFLLSAPSCFLAAKTAGDVPETEEKQTVFTNPVSNIDRPDPTIWYSRGMWYCLSTGTGGGIMTSDDLYHWNKSPFYAYTDAARKQASGIGRHFWAPDVVKVGKWWNLYVSLYNSLQDCGVALFRSRKPGGPFEFSGVITHSLENGIKDSIDPEVVVDPSDGKVWLFFGSTGKMYRVLLNSDGTALAEGAGFTHVAGVDIDVNPSRLKVFEGCYLHKRGNYWYLFASAGLYSDWTYRIVVGRSTSLTGEFVDREGNSMKDGFATTVISSSPGDRFYGPGHNGEIFTDSEGQDYIFYHCHNDSIDGNPGHRFTMLQRLFWDNEGWPYVKDGKPAVEEIAPVK